VKNFSVDAYSASNCDITISIKSDVLGGLMTDVLLETPYLIGDRASPQTGRRERLRAHHGSLEHWDDWCAAWCAAPKCRWHWVTRP